MLTPDKLILIDRLEQRQQLGFIAESGVRKAVAVLNQDLKVNKNDTPILSKSLRYNNPNQFENVFLGNGSYEISYQEGSFEKMYGVLDEERKLNINKVDKTALKNLIEVAAGKQSEEAQKLADALIDWREYGESQIKGFYSDSYYDNLEFPYPKKSTDYEVIDELLLVEGMTQELFEKLSPYLTVYTSGKVNVNTVSAEVLHALGLADALVTKILSARRGPDGREATADDYICQDLSSWQAELARISPLENEEIEQIQQLISDGKLTTESHFFQIRSIAKLKGKQDEQTVICVFHADAGEMLSWQEI